MNCGTIIELLAPLKVLQPLREGLILIPKTGVIHEYQIGISLNMNLHIPLMASLSLIF